MSMDIPGYETLACVLQAAYEQAAVGKGAERHATGLPFDQQPMQTSSDLLGTDAGLAFQAIKKVREGSAFDEFERFERELLGAINYIAGMIIWRQRQQGAKPPEFDWSAALAEQEAAESVTGYDPAGGADETRTVVVTSHPGTAWAVVPAEEPAAQIDDESDRQKAIQQNGPDGAVYDDPWYGAPEWARFKAQDDDGSWFWFKDKPAQLSTVWYSEGRYEIAHNGEHSSPNWRDTLIERP